MILESLCLALLAASDPLTVSTATLANGDTEVAYTLTNNSSKEIDAYVVIIEYLDDSGRAGSQLVQSSVLGLAPDAPIRSRKPGDLWGERARGVPKDIVTGRAPRFRIVVDYVSFSDGTSAGPDTLKHSLRIEGIRTGWRAALAYTKSHEK